MHAPPGSPANDLLPLFAPHDSGRPNRARFLMRRFESCRPLHCPTCECPQKGPGPGISRRYFAATTRCQVGGRDEGLRYEYFPISAKMSEYRLKRIALSAP